MAWIEYREGKNKGSWRIAFRIGEQRFNRSLKTENKDEAEARQARLEESIRLVESGRIEIPPGADIPTFLLSDGKLKQSSSIAVRALTLSQLFEEFFFKLPEGNLEDSTIYGMQRHRRHLERIIGVRFPVQQLTTEVLQNYVSKRSRGCLITSKKVNGLARLLHEVFS
ncbi:hypothetical protein Pan241w_36070 [Gimesia alba]|uniref:Core-binding (CB) domain-containing protein n=1 Tax=Gimesia alba TaxID=2527973 RepID=A0A517RI02_9PLAN|nr:hypothetical protein [Gimesia alba]QDT43506.1 hypothetical protein Pan241w_36070 [Gimesia alba]